MSTLPYAYDKNPENKEVTVHVYSEAALITPPLFSNQDVFLINYFCKDSHFGNKI